MCSVGWLVPGLAHRPCQCLDVSDGCRRTSTRAGRARAELPLYGVGTGAVEMRPRGNDSDVGPSVCGAQCVEPRARRATIALTTRHCLGGFARPVGLTCRRLDVV